MKLHHLIAPVVSLLAAGIWLRHQSTSLNDYQIRADDLKARLSQISTPNSIRPVTAQNRPITDDDFTDWNHLTEADQSPGQPHNQQYLAKFLQHYQKASPQEIADALDQISQQAAGNWLNEQPEGNLKNAAIETYARALRSEEPLAAADWAITLPQGRQKNHLLKNILTTLQ